MSVIVVAVVAAVISYLNFSFFLMHFKLENEWKKKNNKNKKKHEKKISQTTATKMAQNCQVMMWTTIAIQ